MARFCGKVGFITDYSSSNSVDYKPSITEKTYYGDVVQYSRRNDPGVSVNDELTMSVQISIVADPFAYEHASTIAYVEYCGACWKVTSIKVESDRPRIVLSLGGVYRRNKNWIGEIIG